VSGGSASGLAEEAARGAVAAAGRRLEAEGLVARTWGNISVRLGDNGHDVRGHDVRRMAITPSGIAYADIGPGQVVVVDLETGEWSGALKPSGERKLHAAIYRARPDVGAIIHTHQSAASVYAAARSDLLPADGASGVVRCASYALPGTGALVSATVAALGSSAAAFMANHGAVCVGADIDAAFAAARGLERTCADAVAALDASRQPAAAASELPCRIDAPWNPADLVRDGADLVSRAPFTLAWSSSGAGGRVRRLPLALDDLAQLVGVPPFGGAARRCSFVPGEGARLRYAEGADAEAAAMVVEKACRAAIAGELLGGAAAIPLWEAALMRAVYRLKYSRLRNTSPLRSR
jgi:L-fuculose-phosphate aldolase